MVLVVVKGEGLGSEIEWVAGVELAAAASLPAQHQYFLNEHPLLLALGA